MQRTSLFAPFLVACLVLGAALRLTSPDVVAFKLDEAKFVGIVDAAAFGGWPSSGAMSSWGILQPPLRAYLLEPARWVTSDVSAVVLILGLLSALNLAVIAFTAQRFSRAAAVAAVALACASPWVLHFGRALWDAPIPLFGTLALWAGLTAVSGRRRWAFAVVPLAVLQVLTHLTGLSLLPLLAYLPARFAAFRTRWFAGGTLLGGLIALPYIVTLLTAPEPAGQLLGSRLTSLSLPIGRALTFALWYVSGADIQSLLGATHAPEYPFSSALAVGPFIAAGLLLAGLWVGMAERLPSPVLGPLRSPAAGRSQGERRGLPPLPLGEGWGEGKRAEKELLLAWVAVPLLATMLLPGELFVHYLQTWGGGAPFVLMGLGAAWLWGLLRVPLARGLAVAGLLAIPALQAASWVDLLGRLDRLPDTAVGPTLGAWQRLAGAARDAAGVGGQEPGDRGQDATAPGPPIPDPRSPIPVVVWTTGDQPAYQDKPAVLKLLLGPRLDPLFATRDSLVLRESVPNLLVITPPRSDPRWGAKPLPGVRRLEATTAGSAWVVDTSSLPSSSTGGRVEFADGITLEGYEWRPMAAPSPQSTAPSPQIELTTFWRTTAPSARAAAADLTIFVHLEDDQQARIAQEDGFIVPSARWQPGLRIVQVSVLDASRLSGRGWVRLGVYSRRDLQRSPRLDTGADSVLVGPIELPP